MHNKKILRVHVVPRVRHEDAKLKFRDFYFRVLNLLAKNAKFYTSRKLPAIIMVYLLTLQGTIPRAYDPLKECICYAIREGSIEM